jgi:NADH dehydrogenase
VNGLAAPLGPQGRVRVLPTLQLPNAERVFVIGDAAYLEDEDGAALPMMAPVAQQQADHAARSIARALRGEAPAAFRYRNPGSMATIGRHAAVAHVRGLQFSGFFAWVTWLVLHIVLLIGFRNRLLVLINWAWDYFLYDRAVRLIHAREMHTGPAEARRAPHAPDSGDAPAKKAG